MYIYMNIYNLYKRMTIYIYKIKYKYISNEYIYHMNIYIVV